MHHKLTPVSSLPASQYTSTSTTQLHLHSLHLALERLRILARRAGNVTVEPGPSGGPSPAVTNPAARGPRVMVLGPPSSGKTTVVKNLVNMALGSGVGWNVGVAGLDPSSVGYDSLIGANLQPSNLIPGTLSLSSPAHPIPTHHVAHPLGSPPASLPSNTLSADVPTLGWWYGQLEPTTRGVPIWSKIVTAMGDVWSERWRKDPLLAASGLFVDAPSGFANPLLGQTKDDRSRYPLLTQAIDAFDSGLPS